MAYLKRIAGERLEIVKSRLGGLNDPTMEQIADVLEEAFQGLKKKLPLELKESKVPVYNCHKRGENCHKSR